MTNSDTPKKILAVIPARAGSKRLPGKNIKDFCGKPLIAWTIEAAKACPSIDRVIVTTDGEDIAEIARQWGAETPFQRPVELADDTRPNDDAIIHAVEWLEAHQDYRSDYVAALQPTSPLRTSEDLTQCWEMLRNFGGAECASFCPAAKSTQLWQSKPDGVAAYWKQASGEPVSLYQLNGAIYLISTPLLTQGKTWLNPDLQMYVMPASRSVDIDTAEDFDLAEYYMRRNLKKAA